MKKSVCYVYRNVSKLSKSIPVISCKKPMPIVKQDVRTVRGNLKKKTGLRTLNSNGRHGGLSQAVGLRATEHACPCEPEVPFCIPARARRCMAFPVVVALAGSCFPFSAKRNGDGGFVGSGCDDVGKTVRCFF